MAVLEDNDLPWGGQRASTLLDATNVSFQSNLLLRSFKFLKKKKSLSGHNFFLVNTYDRAFPLHSGSQSCLSIRDG